MNFELKTKGPKYLGGTGSNNQSVCPYPIKVLLAGLMLHKMLAVTLSRHYEARQLPKGVALHNEQLHSALHIGAVTLVQDRESDFFEYAGNIKESK